MVIFHGYVNVWQAGYPTIISHYDPIIPHLRCSLREVRPPFLSHLGTAAQPAQPGRRGDVSRATIRLVVDVDQLVYPLVNIQKAIENGDL